MNGDSFRGEGSKVEEFKGSRAEEFKSSRIQKFKGSRDGRGTDAANITGSA